MISIMMSSRDVMTIGAPLVVNLPGGIGESSVSQTTLDLQNLVLSEIFFEPVDVVKAVGDIRLADQLIEKRNCGLDAVDDELRECPAQAHQALVAALAVHDELADEAVVERRDAIALVDAAVDADAEAARRMPVVIWPGEGRKVRGFSALMRHSMAWPENVMSSCL